MVNKTGNGGGKRHGPFPSGLFVFSLPPLIPRQDWTGLWPGIWALSLLHAEELGLVLLGADLEMKVLCPTQIVSLVWDIDPCFLLKGEDGGGLFSVN